MNYEILSLSLYIYIDIENDTLPSHLPSGIEIEVDPSHSITYEEKHTPPIHNET